jgi:hypothetical protein
MTGFLEAISPQILMGSRLGRSARQRPLLLIKPNAIILWQARPGGEMRRGWRPKFPWPPASDATYAKHLPGSGAACGQANAVAPGAIRTPINRPAWETSEAYRRLMTLVPYKRIGGPEDIAQAVAWLVSDAADYVTGATLFVDGGMTLFPGFATGG